MEREQKIQELYNLIDVINDDIPMYKIQQLIEEYHRIMGV